MIALLILAAGLQGQISWFKSPAERIDEAVIRTEISTHPDEVAAETRSSLDVLVIKDGSTEFDIANILRAEGISVDIANVMDHQWDGTNPSPYNYETVIVPDGFSDWSLGMPVQGQNTLVNYVNNGGGVIITGWVHYEFLNGRYQNMGDLILLRRTSGSVAAEQYTVVQNHPVTENLPNNFQVPQHGIDQCNLHSGMTVITGSVAGQAVAVKEYGDGRIVDYSMCGNYDNLHPFLASNELKQLLIDSVRWTAGKGLPQAKAVTLLNATENDLTCYARLEPYTLSVNVSTYEKLHDIAEMKVYLDYNTTNATLCYNWTRGEFSKEQDTEGHVELIGGKCNVSNDGVENWWVNFSLMFNFTFPHEKLVDCYANVTANCGEWSQDRFPYVFRVENDLEFEGTPALTDDHGVKLREGDWINGSRNISVTNFTVKYADSAGVYPDDSHFDVKVKDQGGNIWWDRDSSGEMVLVNITSRNVTDEAEEYRMTIENIPENGKCMTNLTFAIKIDADPPPKPGNLVCHADDFDGRETEKTDLPEMYVTWDEVEDNASGLRGYYYSSRDNSGTPNGTFTTETQVKIENLQEGYSRIHVWCVDNVGNIGESAGSGILIDLTPPVFMASTPPDGEWHNHTDVECSIEIGDQDGSGIDGGSIEYSVSTDGMNNFGLWMPLYFSETEQFLTPKVTYNFREGEDNYIKWRVKDVSGNGFSESEPTNIKIDTTPVTFDGEIPGTELWYDQTDMTAEIHISDSGCGVDPETLEFSATISGPGKFGEWMTVAAENITKKEDGKYSLTVAFTCAEGKDNYVRFRGTDLVRNPLHISDSFNFKVDISPVYFDDFAPDERSASDELEVECFISVYDDGVGVDAGTVEYSVSTEGMEEENFGPWEKAANIVPGRPTQVLAIIEFDWGRDNYVRWRANDIIGTGSNESLPYRIWVNSKPTAFISSPDDGSFFYIDEAIVLNGTGSHDLDGDELEFFWSSNIAVNRSLGTNPVIETKLAVGNHTITLHVADGNEYNVSESIKVNVGERKVEEKKGGDEEEGGGSSTVFSGSSDGNIWLWIILGGIAVLIVLIVIIFLVASKKKKKKRKEESDLAEPRTVQHRQPGRQQPPIPSGPYRPGAQAMSVQGPWGIPAEQPYRLQLPSGPGMGNAFQAPAYPALPAAQPAQSQQGQGQFPSLASGEYQTPAPVIENTYLLPSFSTDEGDQNLNLMALPPASIDGDISPNIAEPPSNSSFPQAMATLVEIPQTPPMVAQLDEPAVPAVGTPVESPTIPIAAETPQESLSTIPAPDILPPGEGDLSLQELDTFFTALRENIGVPPGAGNPPLPPPE